ncbi:non-ribosomal peptide synthetase [Lysinibacillus mangiferihumi]|uniref:Non-ribosomal peptide synthetase n=1 Tax=Lysinibacillus mangiferihumi TaxID=1130819 RepID=A0A4U2ZBP2_9BACI|nr:non-ribosomal peptide synthetase [Lysinibacillus mangiferihumi]TKI71788.1 non-ribosomal peptide synthetase [Lysinibacillus mangiferihumi]
MMTNVNKKLLLETALFKEKRKYWDKQLIDYTLCTHDITDQQTNYSIPFKLDRILQEKLFKMSKESDLSLYILLVFFLKITINKFFNEEDIVIASPIYKGEISINGLNDLVLLRSNINDAGRALDLLTLCKETVLDAYNNQEYPIKSIFGREDEIKEVYVDIACSLSTIHEPFPHTLSAGMHVYFKRINNEIVGVINYSSSKYESFVIHSFIRSFLNIITVITNDINISLKDIDFISQVDKSKVLAFAQWSEKEEKNENIINLFEKAVRKNSNETAIWYEGQSVTYSDLDEKTDYIANRLIDKGVSKGNIIGLYMGRGIEAILGMLGILKAGAAYLPLDPSLPNNRIEYMLNESETKIILTCGNDNWLSNIDKINLLEIGDYSNVKKKPNIKFYGSDLAYVIYTSGSTGNPKGVMIEHNSVANLINGLEQKIFSDYTNCRVAVVAPFYFDASVQQIFSSLLLGHTLYIVPEHTRIDGLSLIEYYRKNHINISDGTPMHLQLLLSLPYSKFNGLALQHFIIGGEILSKKTVKQFLQKSGLNTIRITNVYGPTECCVDSTAYEIIPDNLTQLNEHISIGRPLKNTNVYILNQSSLLCPEGAVGEICISGDGVSSGYMKLSELTSEKFVKNPFEHESILYRTGDLGRWLSDGNIECLGRKDNQVKLKGYRIELGEIEKVLLTHPNVVNVAVVCKKIKNQDELVVYYVSNKNLELEEFKSFLSAILPKYMIPRFFMKLDQLPLTGNGKVNRNQLPTPSETLREKVKYVQPTTMLEISLVSIWRKVLGFDKIGIYNNFFELGGDSLKALRIVLELEKVGLKVKLHDIFKYQTVKSLASSIEESVEEKVDGVDFTTMEQYIYTNYKIYTSGSTYKFEEREYFVLHVEDEKVNTLLGKLHELRDLMTLPHYILPMSHIFEVEDRDIEQINKLKEEILIKVSEENSKLHSVLFENDIINQFPLTPIQKGFLEEKQVYSGTSIDIASNLEQEKVKQAIIELINQQGLLRSVLITENNLQYWQEYACEKDIDIPFYNLTSYSPKEQKTILDILIPELLYEPYHEGSFLYRILLIKLNLNEYKLIIPCHHVIFDGMSSEVIEKELEINLKGLNNQREIIEHYENYQLQIEKGPVLTAREIIRNLNLNEFDYFSKFIYENNKDKFESVSYHQIIQIPIPTEILMNLTDLAWEATIYAIKEFSNVYFNTTNLPILLLNYGRKYQDKAFFSTIGNFLDIVPVLIDKDISDTSSFVRNQLKMVSDNNINFASIVYDQKIRDSYKEVFNTINPYERTTFLLNYHGKGKQEKVQLFNRFNMKKGLGHSNIKKSLISNGIMFDVLYTDEILRLSITSPFIIDERQIKSKLEAYLLNSKGKDVSLTY